MSQSAVRARLATAQLARRGFHSSRAQLSSPFHYPEGPLNNIPFNPRTKYFHVRYLAFVGMSPSLLPKSPVANDSSYRFLGAHPDRPYVLVEHTSFEATNLNHNSLANVQDQISTTGFSSISLVDERANSWLATTAEATISMYRL